MVNGPLLMLMDTGGQRLVIGLDTPVPYRSSAAPITETAGSVYLGNDAPV